MFHIHELYILIRSAIYVFYSEKGGGGGELSFWFSVLLHHGLFVFSVMSEYSLDEPGFTPPVPPVPPSSESSVETPVDGRRILFRVLWLAY